jgi:arylsulfatase A-like enzyme
VSDAIVELRYVMPTLLDCAGLPVPESVDGMSLLPLVRGDGERRSHLHGEHTTLGQSVHWLTDGHEKYVWLSGSGDEQLFDLDADPQELHDLARDSGQSRRVARWRDTLVDALRDRPEGFVSGDRLVAGQRATPVLPAVAAGSS